MEASCLADLGQRVPGETSPPNWTGVLRNMKDEVMAKGQQRGNREAKKPKKEKPKLIAAAPSRKIGTWQPELPATRKK